MYKLLTDILSNEVSSIRRLEDNVCIPLDEANTDYQQYLEWVAEGNEPEPAE